MNIDIKGHSGCDIDIIEKDNKLYVKKSTNDIKYLDRLYMQGIKQQNDNAVASISVPKIYELVKTDTEAYILMDYIYAKNFVDYFEHASPADINNFIDVFVEYINNELKTCDIKHVDKSIFINKMSSVYDNCKKNTLLQDENITELLDRAKNIFDNLPLKIALPIGTCHGDLTFSNILFTNTNFYFIDYLDSFVETPIQDIVKLRQDTSYFWSTLMYTKNYDEIRLKMIFSYIDKKIDECFKSNKYYKESYKTLELMNMLRILPYVKEEYVRDFLVKTINEIIDRYER